MLRNPRRYVPNTTVTHIEFASSKSSQNGGPYRTNLKRGRASTYSPASTHPHIPTTPSPRYSPYPRKPIHTHETPSPTSTHNHLSSSSNGSSTLCSCHSGSIRLSTTAQQSKLLCGVHTSAELSPYRSRADLCLPQIQDPKELAPDDPLSDTMELDLAKETFNLARAVRSNVQAQEYFIQTQIEEGEIVLAMLRKKAEQVATKLQEADRQLGGARAGLASIGLSFPDRPSSGTARHLAVQAALLHSRDDDDDEHLESSILHTAVISALNPRDETDSDGSEEDVSIHS